MVHTTISAPQLLVALAGWFFAQPQKKLPKGSFFEVSENTGSYRAESLGLCTLQLFVSTLEEFYSIKDWTTMFCCDNNTALRQYSWSWHKVKPSASYADILWIIHTLKNYLSAKVTHEHVSAHMGRFHIWHRLSSTPQSSVKISSKQNYSPLVYLHIEVNATKRVLIVPKSQC